MTETQPDESPHLAVTGLVDKAKNYSLAQLHSLGDPAASTGNVVVALGRVIDHAGAADAATHVTAVSTDGTYSASIPLDEAIPKGELHVRPEAGSRPPIRLLVPGGMTLCWNVKGLGLLRVTEGPEPDSLPEVLTH